MSQSGKLRSQPSGGIYRRLSFSSRKTNRTSFLAVKASARLKDYPDVMDIGQMCEALGVSTKTGYKLLKDGKIEYLKIGRAYRIPKAHILRYLKITCSALAE